MDITETRRQFVNPAFFATSVIFLLVMFIRVTRGLDLTDEMQYYGEIEGLIGTGKLFSSDFFIQQTVYILFYPFFYIYHALFGAVGMVFFGRLLMAAISAAVFLYAYRKFLEFSFSPLAAGLTAVSLTFAIPYHGIFAASYNTISQALWIVFAIRFYEWKPRHAISLAAIPVVTGFAHPTAAVMMSVLILLRFCIERDFRQALRLVQVFSVGALIVLPIFFYFAEPQAYFSSLSISSEFGVGSAFFSNNIQRHMLLKIFAMFGCGVLFWKPLRRVNFTLLSCLFAFCGLALCLYSFVRIGPLPHYTTYVLFTYTLSGLSAFAFLWSMSITTPQCAKPRSQIIWLAVLLLAFATTLAVTSGNGIFQTVGAFMVGLPLFMGIAMTRDSRWEEGFLRVIKYLSLLFIFALFSAYWCLNPYRETRWWHADQPIPSVPAFKFLNTSRERADFIQNMQQVLNPMVQGQKTLIVGPFPAFYFALDVIPTTCMFFMHSQPTGYAEKYLYDCLKEKKPDVLIRIAETTDPQLEKVRLQSIVNRFGEDCQQVLSGLPSDKNPSPHPTSTSVCRFHAD